MEAIQAAIRETSPRRSPGAPEFEPTRLALISDDRIAEAARPVLLNLATRWIRSATRALRSHLPGSWQLDVVGAEVIDGATAKEELRGGWVAGMRSSAVDTQDGTAPTAELVIAAHGAVAAARPPPGRREAGGGGGGGEGGRDRKGRAAGGLGRGQAQQRGRPPGRDRSARRARDRGSRRRGRHRRRQALRRRRTDLRH